VTQAANRGSNRTRTQTRARTSACHTPPQHNAAVPPPLPRSLSLTAQVRVAVGGDDLKHAVVNGEDRHIKRAATQVKDQDVLLATLRVVCGAY
jgi:hypothetical protein